MPWTAKPSLNYSLNQSINQAIDLMNCAFLAIEDIVFHDITCQATMYLFKASC